MLQFGGICDHGEFVPSRERFPLKASSRSKARSSDSGDGCIQRCEAVTRACLAILMIVKASAPDSPSRVSIVCLNECSTNSSDSSPRCAYGTSANTRPKF